MCMGEVSYRVLLKIVGCMGFFLAWPARRFFIVVMWAQGPVLENKGFNVSSRMSR
jgi:hypothetical protein